MLYTPADGPVLCRSTLPRRGLSSSESAINQWAEMRGSVGELYRRINLRRQFVRSGWDDGAVSKASAHAGKLYREKEEQACCHLASGSDVVL